MGTVNYLDSHAHLFCDAFEEDFEEMIRRAEEKGVWLLNIMCTELPEAEKAMAYAETAPERITVSCGIFPTDVNELDEATREAFYRVMRDERCTCIGEIGLDYYWDDSRKEEQKKLFHAQLSLARECDLPVVIHDREAHGDCLTIVRQYPGLRGVFHCYSGSPEMAEELLRMGWYLGFDGPITYKNARKTLEVLRICPEDRILVETDSPYLAPVPKRGKRNDPGNLPYICAKIAEIKEKTPEEIAALTAANGRALFGI